MLVPDSAHFGRLAQMVVDRDFQRRGIGRALVKALTARALCELGMSAVCCHARREAYPFYQRMGWCFDSEEFEEAGIPHRKMRIDADAGRQTGVRA